jgi:hypothetical protein
VLENPTDRTHVFEAPGLLEEIPHDQDSVTVEPVRVYIAPKETVRIKVRTDGGRSPSNGPEIYRFFCPLHGHGPDMESVIWIMP